MTAQIDVSIDSADWHRVVPCAEALCRRAAVAALAAAGNVRRPVEVSLALSDDATVAGLNREYRDRHGPTNVLSFATGAASALADFGHGTDADAPPVLLGDVVIARETVVTEAGDQGKSVADHLVHLVIHGLLHLLGHDHADETAAVAMERLETEALAAIGVADPYVQEEPSPA